ncbi:MAG: cytochrome c biogenesis CcdA family protein [Acidimicrobiales bacterium]
MSDVGYAAAFGGGVVSFLSPCVLPLVPAYLSMVTGLDVAELRAGDRRHTGRIVRDTGLFILGFSTVFILLGLSSSAFGGAISNNKLLLTRLSGVLVLAMSLFLVGSLLLKAPWLYREMRFHPSPSRLGPIAAPVTGAAFGFGWTPCIGPVLGSVLAVAGDSGRATHGAALLAVYSAGLGVPFLATGLALGRLSGALGWVKRHTTVVTMGSAIVMGFFGALLVFNRLTWVTSQLQSAFQSVGLDRLVRLG